ncbi:MAG: hypothetical protein MZW92_33850 [Comamonadaceae bacterium]|nr:hypothetical protein [Comamonadaceae bacterium]
MRITWLRSMDAAAADGREEGLGHLHLSAHAPIHDQDPRAASCPIEPARCWTPDAAAADLLSRCCRRRRSTSFEEDRRAQPRHPHAEASATSA